MKYFINLILLFSLTACNEVSKKEITDNPDERIEFPDEPNNEIDPPIIGIFDHSDRVPVYSTLPTYDECLYLATQWQAGDDVYFYWRPVAADETTFMRVDPDGIALINGRPEDQSTWNTAPYSFQVNNLHEIGQCDIDIDTPSTGVISVYWNGELL